MCVKSISDKSDSSSFLFCLISILFDVSISSKMNFPYLKVIVDI